MKILLATGGSGGHIFPALVTAQELKQRGHHVAFAGVFKQSGSTIEAAGFKYFEIPAKGFYRHSPMLFLAAAGKSFFQSLRIFKQFKPDIVAGFGGYGAFPVVMAGILQGFPTIVQEQNVVPGKANKVLFPFVKKFAVGFEQAKKSFPAQKVVVTGCPTRRITRGFDRLALLQGFGLQDGLPIILVLGGSQGSRRINKDFTETVTALKTKRVFSVIHICGEFDAPGCKTFYEKAGVDHCVFSFTDEIDKAYSIADLVVSRAGAMTVTELAAFALPAILIPYPYAGGHQKENALVLTQTRVSRLLEEKDLTPDILAKMILEMLDEKMTKDTIIQSYKGIYRADAVVRLADEIERLKE